MKNIIYFKLKYCPYCIKADKWLDELLEENEQYRKIEIRIVEENVEKAFADSYGYYYVPTFYAGDTKLHEGAATKEKIKKVLDYALGN